MDLNQEIWRAIDATPKLSDESKKTLHAKVMRLFEQARTSPVGKKLGVTVMTQEGSLAGDRSAQNRDAPQDPNSARPKSI